MVMTAAAAATCLLSSTPVAARQVFEQVNGLRVGAGRATAHPNATSMVYEGQFSQARIERAEAGAAPKLQPSAIESEVLRGLLIRLLLRYPKAAALPRPSPMGIKESGKVTFP